jgi:hypothetical protein
MSEGTVEGSEAERSPLSRAHSTKTRVAQLHRENSYETCARRPLHEQLTREQSRLT